MGQIPGFALGRAFLYLSIFIHSIFIIVTKQPWRSIGVSLTGDTVRAQPG